MPETVTASLEAAAARSAESTLEKIAAARVAIDTVIFGQEQVIELALVTLLAGGHGLLVGVPGLMARVTTVLSSPVTVLPPASTTRIEG